ncbi:TPA: dTDP-4-dehydrorhamnose reductase [Klebsiella pneumoniae]
MKPCVLVTGANGQVGHELMQHAPDALKVIGLDSSELDITDALAVEQCIARLKPAVIINAAAYTAVDKAESEPERAYAVNRDGVAHLANSAQQHGACLLHLSTDYVFSGESERPYREDDPTGPINTYGASKLAGEQELQARCARHIIVRTSWVFGRHGNNFVKTMLRLAKERDEINVVADQIGCPTSASSIAELLWSLTQRYLNEGQLPWGVYHFSNQPACSWYEFALEIFRQAQQAGTLERIPKINPIPSSAYPTPAKRPRSSALGSKSIYGKTTIKETQWNHELTKILSK